MATSIQNALEANSRIGDQGNDLTFQTAATTSTKDTSGRITGAQDLSKIQKKYNVTPLTPSPQQGGFDFGAMLGGAASSIGSSLSGAAGAVGNVANNAFKFGGDILNNAGNVAQAANPWSGEDLGKRASRLGETAMNVGKTAIQPIMGVGQDVAGGLGDIYQGITGKGDLGSKLGQAMSGVGKLGGIAQMGIGAPGMKAFANAGFPNLPDAQGKFYGDIGKAAGKGIQDTGTGALNIGTGIGQLTQGKTSEGLDNILRKGLFQAASGATNAVYSPIAGAMGTLPDFAKQGLGEVAKAGEGAINESMRHVGLDPDSIQGKNVKAGLQALMDVGSLGAGKVVGGALRSGKLGATAAKAAEATAAFSGKAADTFDNLVKSAVSGVGKGVKKAANAGLDTASNALWTTPSETIRKIHANGDDFLKAMDNPVAAQAETMGRMSTAIDDAITKSKTEGAAYDTFKKSGQSATLPPEGVLKKFDEAGLTFKDGELMPKEGNFDNTRMTPEDVAYLNKKLVPTLPIGKEMTAEQYINSRRKLDDLAGYNMGIPERTDAVRSLVSDVRMTANDAAHNLFTGLKDIDNASSAAINELKTLRASFMKKDPVTKKYVLKNDIQPETLSNLLSPRNRSRLEQFEKVAPGVTKQLEVLDLVKRVEKASNSQTGAGFKRIGSLMAGNTFGGPIGALAGFFITDPAKAARLFARMGKWQAAGKLKKSVRGAEETVKDAGKVKKAAKKGAETFADAINNQQQQPTTSKGGLAQAVRMGDTVKITLDPKKYGAMREAYYRDNPGSIQAAKTKTTGKNPIVNKKTGETLSDAVKKLEGYGWSEKDIANYKNSVLGKNPPKPKVDAPIDKAPEYAMSHRPSKLGDGFDISNKEGIPADVYDHPEWYFNMRDAAYQESYQSLLRIRNKPDATVTVYRASPKDELNHGDWISLSKRYAKGESLSEGTKVHAFKVKAKDIQFAGDDLNEFGYFPQS